MVIAPIALVIAVAHILNKLATDSEIIVMNAAGMSPWRLFHAVHRRRRSWSSLMVAAISAYVAPEGSARAAPTGSPRCAPISSATSSSPAASPRSNSGLAFHIRERRPNGLLVGMFLDDRRDPKERITIIAEQRRDREERQRHLPAFCRTAASSATKAKQRDPNIVVFDRYAFDLSQFAGRQPGGQILGARALPLAADRARHRTIRSSRNSRTVPRRTA